jgi:hypothetical protein
MAFGIEIADISVGGLVSFADRVGERNDYPVIRGGAYYRR